MTTVPIEVDDDLLKIVDAQAAESGKPRGELLAAALRRDLGGGQLGGSSRMPASPRARRG